MILTAIDTYNTPLSLRLKLFCPYKSLADNKLRLGLCHISQNTFKGKLQDEDVQCYVLRE